MPVIAGKPKIWTENVSKAWDLPEKLTVSEWADRCRVLGSDNAEPGRWHTERTPYLRGIMDAFTDTDIEDITIMKPTQVGGTEAMLNMLGFIVDQDPGPTLYVMPREPDAKSFSSNRILPMLQLSGELREHFTENTDDISRLELKLDRMTVYLAGSNSPAALASRPIKTVLFDETDKYPHFSGKEADPIELATERQKTFWNRKTVKTSTPTTENGFIFREYNLSDKCQFYIPCPHCGKMQTLAWAQIKFPKEARDPEKILADRLAWYECIKCHGKITDQMKHGMLKKGRWVPEKYKDHVDDLSFEFPKSKRTGFWLNAIYSPWVSFSEMVSKWLKAQGRPELLMNFVNSWLAEPWREEIIKREPDKLKELALFYPAGTVPEDVICLTAAVDVQKDHFVVGIRGWGYYQESWGIIERTVETWADVDKMLFETTYPSVNPNVEPLAVRLALVDTGFRTSEVYDFCRSHIGQIRAIKGRNDLQGVPFKVAKIDKYPDGRPMQGEGLQLWHLDTTYYKDKLSRLINNTKDGTVGGWHIHADPSDDYINQVCGESKKLIRDKESGQMREEWIKTGTNNYFDVEVYNVLAADMLHIYELRPENAPRVHRPEPARGRGAWVPDTGNWLDRS